MDITKKDRNGKPITAKRQEAIDKMKELEDYKIKQYKLRKKTDKEIPLSDKHRRYLWGIKKSEG